MPNYHNSRFRIKEDAKPLQRSTKPMKRTQMKRVPGTARMARNVFGLKPKREDPRETRFKKQVRERDDYTCQFPGCGYQSKHIDVHHVAKRSRRPDLRFDVSNGLCLCRKHHSWTDYHHDEAVRMGLLDITRYELAMKELDCRERGIDG
jgi:predicted restriction endonuclease